MTLNQVKNIMKIGGVANFVCVPILVLVYPHLTAFFSTPLAEVSVWFYSFFYCTLVLGLLYVKVSDDPVKYSSFAQLMVVAKAWGLLACGYGIYKGHIWLILIGSYDVFFLLYFVAAYRAIKRLQSPAVAAWQ